MISIQGKGVSSGVGAGPLYFYQRAQTEIPRYTVEDTDAEWHRFKGAQTGAVEQLGDLAEKARAEAGDEAAMLFETHQMMAEDLDYEEAIEQRITEEKMNAEAAIADTAEQFAAMFEAMDDSYMQARAADVKDVSRRLLDILSGAVAGGIASDVPVILAADDLAPSETVQLDKSKILGFITAGGSGSSHTAILARTMGIPAIVGVGGALKAEYAGRPVIIDGATGNVVIDPDDMTRDRLMKKREEQLRLQRLLETLKGQPNVTKDGKSIRVYCNIGSPEDVHAVQVNDGGGIGLFRSEFLYLNCEDYPTENQQFEAYKQVLSDTNDLTQYTLACDRQNNDLGRFYDPHHPAVLRMIRLVTQNAHKNGIWVGICGELGADLTLTETFLAIGVDELSVSPRAVLPLRNAIRMTDTRETGPRILAALSDEYTNN